MKKYILFRKLVDQKQIILYSEMEEVELTFREKSPKEILSYIYGNTSSVLFFNSISDVLATLEDQMEACTKEDRMSTDIMPILLTYLFLNEDNKEREFWGNINEHLNSWFHGLRENLIQSGGKKQSPSLRRSHHWHSKLTHYFTCLNLDSLAFFYPTFVRTHGSLIALTVENTVDCLKEDLKEESYKPVALIYCLYRHYFPVVEFFEKFSEFLASPEVV